MEPADGEQITRQFQLPADWETLCPKPFLHAMVKSGNYDAYTWSVSEENVLTVTGYYYTIFSRYSSKILQIHCHISKSTRFKF